MARAGRCRCAWRPWRVALLSGFVFIVVLVAVEWPFELITLPTSVGKKRALTAATAQARGDILAYTDSDCVLAPEALERCLAALQGDPNLGAVIKVVTMDRKGLKKDEPIPAGLRSLSKLVRLGAGRE